MDDDFDLKPRLRKLAVYVAGVVALVIVIVVVLTVISHSGKTTTVLANGTTSTSTSSKNVNSKWEYSSVLARCAFDKQTSKMICNRIPKGDLTDVTGVVSEMSNSGWELVGVSNGNDKGGAVSAFMFKRAK